jgi:hypothetical protein
MLCKCEIIGYLRYIDDILIIYNNHITQIENTVSVFISVHISPKFTTGKKTLNYFDLSIINNKKNLGFDGYRKPNITTDSWHPFEGNTAGTKYLVNRVETYPVSQKSKQNEQR